jgi:hypothetical protein
MSVYDDASLVLIPSGYKASKLYSVVPSDGSGDLTFSRTTTGTRVNEDGLIESVGINVPRIDFTGSGCGKLLLEPQRTNNIEYSKDFENLYWTKTGSSITANNTTSPDGTTNADKLSEDSANNFHSVHKSTQAINGRQYSVFAKANGRDWILLTSHSSSAPAARGQFFNVSNGTVGTGGDATTNAKIEDYGNGWYRCTISEGSNFSSIYTVMLAQSDGGSVIYTGDGSSGVYIWQADNQEDYMTSPIPTAGSTVTRTADESSTSGLSSLINSVEGVLYFKGQSLFNDLTNRSISISDGTASNSVVIKYSSTTQTILADVIVSGVSQCLISYAVADTTDVHKIAIRYKANDFSIWVDGVERATDTSGSTFSASTLDTLSFDNGAGVSSFYGKISELVLAEYLTDTEIAALTTV